MALSNTERAIRARETKSRARLRSNEIESRPISKAAEADNAKAAQERKSK